MRTAQTLWLAVLLLAGACTRIEEPWVQDEQQLKEERARDAVQQKALRDRLATTQIDR